MLTNTSVDAVQIANNILCEVGPLVDVLNRNTRVTHLLLQAPRLGEAGCVEMASKLRDARNSSLRSLNLRSSNIGVEGAKSLASFVAVNSSLRYLNLYNNAICDAGFVPIVEALRNNATLRELSVRANRLTSVSLPPLIELLSNDRCALTSLNVGYNCFDDAHAQRLSFVFNTNFRLCCLFLDTTAVSDDLLSHINRLCARNDELRLKNVHEIVLNMCLALHPLPSVSLCMTFSLVCSL